MVFLPIVESLDEIMLVCNGIWRMLTCQGVVPARRAAIQTSQIRGTATGSIQTSQIRGSAIEASQSRVV